MIRWVVVLASTSLFAGCSGSGEPTPCNPAPQCPVLDEQAGIDDVRVAWAEGQKLVMTLDGVASDVAVIGGEAAFTPDPNDPDCQENCAVTLKRLRIKFRNFYLVSSQDSVKVAGLELAFRTPSVLAKGSADASIIPAGTETVACATAQNALSAFESKLHQDGQLVARAESEVLTFDAVVPVRVDATTAQGCRAFDLELSGTLSGATPFAQNPTLPE